MTLPRENSFPENDYKPGVQRRQKERAPGIRPTLWFIAENLRQFSGAVGQRLDFLAVGSGHLAGLLIEEAGDLEALRHLGERNDR